MNGRILAIEAHPDDVEWGCWATLTQAAAVCVMCMTAESRTRRDEASKAFRGLTMQKAIEFAPGLEENRIDLALCADMVWKTYEWFAPDVVLTHDRGDGHQDHRAVFQSTEIALRYEACVVLEYPSPSSMSFQSNVLVPITGEALGRKIDALLCHASQEDKRFMRPDVVRAMAKYEGRFLAGGLAEGLRWAKGVM